ncbi:META domain-containing protein [Kineosporia sp. J2-2]|uniref:META domain-containing protein n=1 Tax=Kineosporia corallincola TaxID=2835133 RepID=A0ABS5TEW5_9ACTN|nr:META domain-containing protein [Kineosporia corallincola]MBT0768761.1 META domain-containing protein [Kineosporia corallincola]
MIRNWWGASLVALTVVTAGCGAASGSGAKPDQGVRDDVLGTWYPWDIPGYTTDEFGMQTFRDASITFSDDGTWKGSDGCNGLGGTYEVTVEGGFTATPPEATTMIGCANVPNVTVLTTATQVEKRGEELVFSGKGGVTGRYLATPQASPSPSVEVSEK